MQKEIGKFKKKKEGTQLKKLKVGWLKPCPAFPRTKPCAPKPAPLRLYPCTCPAPNPGLALHRACAPAAPSLRLDHAQISLLCAPCCVDPAAAPLSLQPTEHETNLQDDITLQLCWLPCRASFGLTRSTVEGKRRKIEGFG
ncbi:hypothetical protein SLEP1_g55609 [Rubroshorea leprosula]|uniref:Uncharacterized protein n=1 Tax=Rubroshorea leprosula TaxID=152421 RepID=A0AAV5MJQ8_9ROSI|nr:hypothetical protein SLEP1_g55609 [Rubroshorea leprosula]